MSHLNRKNKKFDLIVWGSTGYTGKLVCEYIQKKYKNTNLKWAIAGRNELKIKSIISLLNLKDIPYFIADSNNKDSLLEMTKMTKTICSIVGPYAKYGTLLVEACIESKTNYCDITGETQWIREIIDKYHTKAIKNKVKIVHACGFDSVPSDLGVFYAQNKMKESTGKYASKIIMRVISMKGGVSGGTIHSFLNILEESRKNKSITKILSNPHGLSPNVDLFETEEEDLKKIIFDSTCKRWISPFIMAAINTRVVRRSNYLLAFKYGRVFIYNEALVLGRSILSKFLGYFRLIPIYLISKVKNLVLKSFLRLVLPKPGKGPTENSRKSGFFKLRFYVFDKKLKAIVSVYGVGCPGYGSTSKMLAESSICLAKDKLPIQNGVLTPSTGLGNAFLNRLQKNADLKFKIKFL
tara:strand:+ start:3997 stop:5223 length:1227 start_codon:yes stop_codon:yes gene_type:complete